MENEIEISEKEKERRRKISEYRKKVIAEKKKKKKTKEAEKKKHKRPVGRPKKRGPKKKRYRKASNSKKFIIFNRYSALGVNCENQDNIYPSEKIKLIEESKGDSDKTANGYIYKYTFPNMKVYIGQTMQSVEKRFQDHINGSKQPRPQRCDIAIKKYGPENVIVETLESLSCSNIELLKETLDELETYYIRLYNSNFVEYGYNLTIGGRGQLSRNIKLDKETLKKVWEEIRNPNLKKRGRKELPPFTYVIISTKNGNQNRFIGQYRNEKEAYNAFNQIKKIENNIMFPVSFTGANKLNESVDEYVLLHLCFEDGDKTKYTKKNNGGCEIIDSFRYYKEETFGVWGYDNKSDRKTFKWILENIVLKNIRPKYIKNTYKNILTYKNKIIIKSTTGTTDIIFCKNITDAQKFYELLLKYIKKDRLNSVKFCGDFSKISKERKKLEQELMDITGFSKKKIQMKSNSYFNIKE